MVRAEVGHMTGSPVVGAVVVTYRRPELVAETLSKVLGQSAPPSHVVVVDNDADRALASTLAERFPGIDYLPSRDNLGFGAGLSMGMSWLRQQYDCDWYWLLDDDSPPDRDALAFAVICGTSAPRVGVVANRGGHMRWGRVRHDVHEVIGVDPVPADFTLVDGSIVSEAAVLSAGLPRTDLFMMLEDIEYTTRIRDAGWSLLVRPSDRSTFLHLGSGADWRGYYQARNHLRIALDRRSPVWFAGWLCREAGITVTLVRRWRWRALRLRAAGWRDGLLGRMGRRVEPSG